MDQIPLDAIILEANASGWAVRLSQHPDRTDYWECHLSRAIHPPRADGIARAIAFAIAPTPAHALSLALEQTVYETCEPAGLAAASTEPAEDIFAILNIKPAQPQIARRL